MQTGGNDKRIIDDVVSSYNRDEKEEAVRNKAAEFNLPYFDVRDIELAPDVISLVSLDEAQKGVLPIVKKGDEVTIGVANPASEEAKKTVEYLSGFFKVTTALISWDSIKDSLPRFDGLRKQKLEKEKDYEIKIGESSMTFEELAAEINTAPLKEILKYILSAAIHAQSSDIHLEPQEEGARIRFRIDGVLHVVGKMDKERYDYVVSQIQLSSGMKLNVDEAQEGRFEIVIKEATVNVRVEAMPTLYGQDIALRLFNSDATMLQLHDLGLSDYNREIVENVLARPQGMILVVGPTGAGKTTTIYAILNRLNEPGLKLITLEDPIEYAVPGISQSQIEENSSFAIRLKAVLREDPDIIMVGEIRDAETADVALHAALTGHLMVSSFHANNASAAVGLLKEITDNNSLLSSGINLIIAQRLVRKLCDNCKKEYQPTEEEYAFAQRVFNGIPDEVKTDKVLKFYEAEGCEVCGNLGYSGRIGIFELLPLTVELQKIVNKDDVTISEIQDAAKKSGMITMEQDGLLKSIDGVTSLVEVMKAVRE